MALFLLRVRNHSKLTVPGLHFIFTMSKADRADGKNFVFDEIT